MSEVNTRVARFILAFVGVGIVLFGLIMGPKLYERLALVEIRRYEETFVPLECITSRHRITGTFYLEVRGLSGERLCRTALDGVYTVRQENQGGLLLRESSRRRDGVVVSRKGGRRIPEYLDGYLEHLIYTVDSGGRNLFTRRFAREDLRAEGD